MKSIGITGGVGAGKSEILEYIRTNYNCHIITADKLAYELECPGHECYEEIVSVMGEDVLDESGFIDRGKMAAKMFSDKDMINRVNGILHPAVKREVLRQIKLSREENKIDFFFLEAALLIEEHYDEILDELWYIRVPEDIRRQRLKSSRGYSDEKINAIFSAQLSDMEFAKYCKVVIENGGALEETYKQIDRALMI